MRSPYGGLTTSVPCSSGAIDGAGRSSASPPLKVTTWATPARAALRRAKSTMRNETSAPDTGTCAGWMRACAAAFRRCQSARVLGSPNGSKPSKAKWRFSPGAMPQAIWAASIAIVPEPQQGSCSAPPCSGVPRHPAAARIAAASVSFSGASPLSVRQPRLNRPSPDVSA